MTAAAADKCITDAEIALALVYFVQCGPDEHTGTAADFLRGIGGVSTPDIEQGLTQVTQARDLGVPFEKFNVQAIAQSVMGWDSVRSAVAFAEAEAAGWLTAVGKEPS